MSDTSLRGGGFQSTSPVWRTTRNAFAFLGTLSISIHVPRVEDDSRIGQPHSRIINFNPRPPCGGRLFLLSVPSSFFLFQSTSPVWRTTSIMIVSLIYQIISIHVPRVEDYTLHELPTWTRRNFQPRPPCGGRLLYGTGTNMPVDFNPRPPCGGRRNKCNKSAWIRNFNPRPPCGGRRKFESICIFVFYFNPRPPCGGRRF